MSVFMGAVLVMGTVFTVLAVRSARKKKARKEAGREALKRYRFPGFLLQRVRAQHPHLKDEDLALIERGLRQFFEACIDADGAYVAMPSAAVDAMWHEFVLYTAEYERFCMAVFGGVLHHTPDEALPAKRAAGRKSQGLRRAWEAACRAEGRDPKLAMVLPALFAADAALAWEGGFHHDPKALTRRFAARDGGSGGGCGSSCGSSGDGCADGAGSCGGDGGGGDGGCGSSCGGGCGGGD